MPFTPASTEIIYWNHLLCQSCWSMILEVNLSRQAGISRMEVVYCACGCGQKMPKYDKRGRPRQFIKPHAQILINKVRGPLPIETRFWMKVRAGKTPEDCWEWIGSKRHDYGQLSSVRGRSPHKAHRVSYEIHFGPIPDGMDVLHSCDNPPCCNPRHLRLGTAKDNARDMVERGRYNPRSLLNLRPGAPGFKGAGPKSRLELKQWPDSIKP